MPDRRNQVLNNFLDLCRVPSPSLAERAVAKVLAKKIRDIGFEPLEDDTAQVLGGDCGNIIVKVPGTGSGPRLLLSAHIDTVEKKNAPAAEPVVDGDWVRRQGGGILGADDKAGVTVLLQVMDELRRKKMKHNDLLFVFSVAEEIECLGAAEVDPDLYKGLDAGVVLDYSRPSDIVFAAPTKVSFRITVHGTAGHAAFPENKVNAAYVMGQTVARLPMGRLDSFTTANLGIMHSGTAINIIPGTAYAEYEIRSHRKDVLDFHVKRVIGIIEGVVRENRVFDIGGADTGMGAAHEGQNRQPINYSQVDVDVEVGYEGYRLAEDAPVVRMLMAAATEAGLDPKLTVAQGGSDANIFNRRDLPSAVIGCGMYGAHGDNERANIQDMVDAVGLLLHLVSPKRTSQRSSGRVSSRKKA